MMQTIVTETSIIHRAATIEGAVEVSVAEEVFRAAGPRFDKPLPAASKLQVVFTDVTQLALREKTWCLGIT
jgi:hypothetical protein